MDKAALESSLHTLDILLIVFGVLVAIGVVGESVVGFLHWRRSNQLQAVQQLQILGLQHGIADANAHVADATLQLERLRRQVGPRVIDADAFLKALADHPPPNNIVIRFSEDATDGVQLAMQLQSLLSAAKWNPAPPKQLLRDDPLLRPAVTEFADVMSQVWIVGPWGPQNENSPFNVLRQALSESLGTVPGRLQSNIPAGSLVVVIGHR